MKSLELLQTITADQLVLSGLYKAGDINKPAVIIVHGFTGDFYTFPFKQIIQARLAESNIGSVCIQTRGTGIMSEFRRADRDDVDFIGSYYEKLEDAHLDISAWIERLQQEGYTRFIIAGHSLGTIKTVRYLFEGKYADLIEKIVLLAPFDKNAYVEDKTNGEWHQHVKLAAEKIASGEELEIIPNTFDDFDMSYRTYYSWYREDDLNSMWDFYRGVTYDFPTLRAIKIPVQIIVGESDDFFFFRKYNTLEQTVGLLKKHIPFLDIHTLPGCGHLYLNYEEEVAKLVYEYCY